jgi:hypothetical protein
LDFEGRGAVRINSENLLAFRLFDKEGRVCNEGMVETLDISRTGIAIQFKEAMDIGLKIELTIGLGDDIVKTTGKVRNLQKVDDGQFQIGIEFDFLTDEDLNKIAIVYPSILK